MGTPEKTDEQKRQEAKLAEEKAKHDLQQSANDDMSKRLGKPVDHDQRFSPIEFVTNEFTDKNSGRPDWIKLLVTGLGGIAFGIMGADLGAVGALISGAIGLVVAGVGGSFLVNMIRGDDDPNKNPRGMSLNRPGAPSVNTNVISNNVIKVPGQADITVPTYNPAENSAPPALQSEIETWRNIVAKGNPYQDATNKHSRQMLEALESAENKWEINMRYLRDTLPGALNVPADKIDTYLNQLSPEAQKALSAKLDIDLSSVPGQKGLLPPELEAYGKSIKADTIAELSGQKNSDAEAAVGSAWDNLSVVAKRNLINNYANDKINAVLNGKTSTNDMFPEYEKRIGDTGIYFNYHDFIPLGNLEKDFKDAYRRGDFKAMKDAVQKRLDDDANMTGGSKLDDNTKNKMKELIVGLEAKEELKSLDAYIAGPLAKDLSKLHEFETSLTQQSQRVSKLQTRMERFSQTGNKQDLLTDTPSPAPLSADAKKAVADIKLNGFTQINSDSAALPANLPLKPVKPNPTVKPAQPTR